MYVRICLCIYTCMYVYTYVCMYQRKKVCDLCTCVYMHGSLYTLLIYVCTYIYTLYLPLANSQEQPPSKLIKKQKQPPENTGLLAKAKNYVREGSSGSGYFTTTPTPVPSNSLTPSPPPFFITARFLQQRLFFTTTPTPVQCLPTPSTLTCHPSPSPPTPLNSKASTLIPNAGIWQRSRTLLYPQLSPYLPTATVPYFVNGIGHGTLLSPQPSVLSLSRARARAISFCRSLCPTILTPVHTFVVFAKRRQIRV